MSRFEKGDLVFNTECGGVYMVVGPAAYTLYNETMNLKISCRSDKLRPATLEAQKERLEEQARMLKEAEEELKYQDL